MSSDRLPKLFIPGPVDISPETYEAMCQPMIGHRGKDFEELYGYDPDAARELMIQAGYGPDNPMEFTIFNYNSSDEPETPINSTACPAVRITEPP